MPITDDEKRRKYFRDYMRRQRAGPMSGIRIKPASPQPAPDLVPSLRAEINALKERVRVLEAEVARLRAAKAEQPKPEPKATPKPTQPKPPPAQPAPTKEQCDPDAVRRKIVEDCVRALVYRVPRHFLQDERMRKTDTREAICAAFMGRYDMLKEIVAPDRGISRAIFRRVWADLHPDSATGNPTAFQVLKSLERKIVVKQVTTYADLERKRAERSARAKAAWAKRKGK
jgi:hypothetical protein